VTETTWRGLGQTLTKQLALLIGSIAVATPAARKDIIPLRESRGGHGARLVLWVADVAPSRVNLQQPR
jgi:hypothetical protein